MSFIISVSIIQAAASSKSKVLLHLCFRRVPSAPPTLPSVQECGLSEYSTIKRQSVRVDVPDFWVEIYFKKSTVGNIMFIFLPHSDPTTKFIYFSFGGI